jgi:S1-C subfamily serine protease
MDSLGGRKPLFVKIAPELSSTAIDDVIEVVLDNALTGIIATNTTVSPDIKAKYGECWRSDDDAPVALEQRRAVGLPPLTGLLVRHVVPTGAAAAAGIRPGDLLMAANRRPLRNRYDLHLALNQSRQHRGVISLEATRGADPLRLRLTAPPPPVSI